MATTPEIGLFIEEDNGNTESSKLNYLSTIIMFTDWHRGTMQHVAIPYVSTLLSAETAMFTASSSRHRDNPALFSKR